MKSFLCLLLCLFTINFASSQGIYEEKPIVDIFKPKDVMVTFFASYPNFETYVLTRLFNPEDNNLEDFRINGIAPIGLRGELFFNNQFSGTLEAMINNWNLNYIDNNIKVSADMTQFRILLGFNYHILDHNVENLNLFSGFAIGTNSRTFNRTASSDYYNYPNILNVSNFIGFPLSLRYRFGGRYFINDNWAIYSEAGIGGPIISIGISYKR